MNMLVTAPATTKKTTVTFGRDFIWTSKASESDKEKAFKEFQFRQRLNDKNQKDRAEDFDYCMTLAIIVNSGQRERYVMPEYIEFKDGTHMTPQEFFDYVDKLKALSKTDKSFDHDLSDSEQLAEVLDELICPNCDYMLHLEKHI